MGGIANLADATLVSRNASGAAMGTVLEVISVTSGFGLQRRRVRPIACARAYGEQAREND